VGPAAVLGLVRERQFGPYFAGNALSATGTWFQNLAASLLLYRQTHSPLLLGVLNFCQFIPILVLVPWTGSAADRLERRRLLLVAQTAGAALGVGISALAWAGLARPGVLIAFALAFGVVSAFSAPAQQALVTQLVPAHEIPSAVALNSMTFNLARAVGPALGAVSVEQLGIPASFLLNAVSYGLFLVALLVVRPAPQRLASREESRLRELVEVIRGEPRLAVLLFIVMAVGFGSDPVNSLAPAWAHAFGRRDTVAGFVIGAFGAGAVSAALVVAGRVAGTRRRMVATLLLLAGGLVALALTPWLPLAFVFLFVAGFGYLASNTHATSRLQLEVEERLRGRIMALWSIAFLGLRPFASLLDGAIASAAGVRPAAVVLAVPAFAAAALVWVRARRLESAAATGG
jgi:MFS family permease